MNPRLRLILPCAMALAASTGTHSAQAANFSFSPTSIETTARERSGTVTLINASDAPIRFETAAMRWDQSVAGKMMLAPTDDLLVFPSILTLAPREKRLLRVTVLADPGEREKTYRVQVTEIPEFRGVNKSGPSIMVLSQVELPVFFAPHSGGATAPVVVGANARAGTFTFSIANQGAIRFRVDHVNVTGIGNGERPVFNTSLEGWYVLAGGRREFSVPIPAQSCDRVRAIAISGDADVPLKETISLPPGACHA